MDAFFSNDSLPDPFEKLPALAERLGVTPVEIAAPSTVIMMVKDGRKYDLFDLINAFLDKLDNR
jgi:hypothetical protein